MNIISNLATLMIFLLYTVSRSQGVILRKITTFDDSSLFSSVNFAISSGKLEQGDNEELRRKLANAIVENPDEYGDIIPEILKWYDTVENYCKWILQETSPGDDIVLAILSTYFQVEIAVGDWEKKAFRKPFFGERATIPHTQRIYLMMTKYGTKIHYDVLYESFLGDKNKKTLFPTNDLEALREVGEYVFRYFLDSLV